MPTSLAFWVVPPLSLTSSALLAKVLGTVAFCIVIALPTLAMLFLGKLMLDPFKGDRAKNSFMRNMMFSTGEPAQLAKIARSEKLLRLSFRIFVRIWMALLVLGVSIAAIATIWKGWSGK